MPRVIRTGQYIPRNGSVGLEKRPGDRASSRPQRNQVRFLSRRRRADLLIDVLALYRRTREAGGLLAFRARDVLVHEGLLLPGEVGQPGVEQLGGVAEVEALVELPDDDVVVDDVDVLALVVRDVLVVVDDLVGRGAARLGARVALRVLVDLLVPVTLVLHLTPFEELEMVGMHHGSLDRDRVFSRPLSHLLVHLGYLRRMDRPEAALALATVAGGLLDLLEALVQRQVMPHGIFPARWRGLEVGKVSAA